MPVWCGMKTSIKQSGASQSNAFLLGPVSSLVHLSRWKDFVVHHGREVLKQLLNSLKCVWSEKFYAMNLKYLGPVSVDLNLDACRQLKLLLSSRFRKNPHFV